MAQSESLETYFNTNEIEGAKKFLEFFQGKLLVSNELSRTDAVLLGTYMISNSNKTSEVPRDDLAKFVGQLGVSSSDFSKAVYDLKKTKLLSESGDKLGITFAGLKKVREFLVPVSTPIEAVPVQIGLPKRDIPSVEAPGSLREAITKLLSAEWGKKPRNLREITEALETNALYYPSSSIAANLNFMTKDGILRRMKSNGTWEYVLKKRPQ